MFDEELVRDDEMEWLQPLDYMLILLRQEGVTPFTGASVAAYKMAQVAEHTPLIPLEAD